jgi:hypothetical protein
VLKIDGKEVANAYGSTLSYSTTAPTAEATGSKGKGGGGGGGGGKGNNKTTSSSTGSMNISAEAFDAAGNSKSTTVTVYY